MQDAGTWPASMSQEQLHQCLATAIAACGLRRQRPTLWSTPVGCLMAADLIAWAAGRMRQSSPNQKAHGATDLRLVDFASSIIFGVLILVSFCLGLSALLAIPLFQDKSRAEQLTADTLLRTLNEDALSVEAFDKSFPETLPSSGTLPDDFTLASALVHPGI